MRAVLLIAAVLFSSPAVAEIRMPQPAGHEAILVRADASSRWNEGEYEVRRLQGNVSISQGGVVARADDAVVWVKHAEALGRATVVTAYLEASGDRMIEVEWSQPAAEGESHVARQRTPSWFGRFGTIASIDWRTPEPTPRPEKLPAIHARGAAMFAPRPVESAVVQAAVGAPGAPSERGAVQQAQFQGGPFPSQLAPPPSAVVSNPLGFRSVQINPRSDVGARAEFIPQPNGESVAVVTGGVNVIVEGIIAPNDITGVLGPIEKIDLETDRAVIWTSGDVGLAGGFQQQNDMPLEIYMEGNIVFRSGDRTVYADRMYYDVRTQTGVILNAEVLTPIAGIEGVDYPGLVRLKAGVVRQLDDARFVANDALVTTSRLEEPSYSLSSDTITFFDSRKSVIDPATGIVSYEHERRARSQNNTVEFSGVPLLYWPTINTNLEKPTFYINDVRFSQDAIFGTQLMVDLDVYEVFGLEKIDGTEWDLSLDYLSDRGFGYGTEFTYNINSFAGIAGPSVGRFDAWAIDDDGLDNLGFGRRDIAPEKSYRGRLFWNHRQRFVDGLLDGWTAQAEVGWISDRTFLEQYFEAEWDNNKDQTTGLRFKRLIENQSISIEANVQLNDFFTQTQWLPRIDHYWLGQELFGDRFTWFAHSQAAYANLNAASTPSNATLAGDFDLFPWETRTDGVTPTPAEGERFVTRQEIDLPLDFAPIRVTPYALGELAHWGADIDGDDLQRAYVHTGVRASLPMWAANPNIQDPLFNLNGLAHKVVFDAELWYADANENFDQLPLYDPIDDDSIEEIRRALFEPPFPIEFDPRFYAIRTGMQGWVTAPSTELVEDQMAARLGMRHRLQTKRGAPGRQRIVDWLTLDSNATFFPKAGRDNFGEDVGLLDYDLRWHVGDRFAIVSDGYADVFDNGLRMVSGGVRLNRPTRGNAYLGYRVIRGPVTADLLMLSTNYRLGPKWVASGSTVFDFSDAGNIGQSFAITRIGESINFTIGGNVDASKNNVGFNFLLEPRFLPAQTITRRTGIIVPPAGTEFFE